jgi:hypothetical protein
LCLYVLRDATVTFCHFVTLRHATVTLLLLLVAVSLRPFGRKPHGLFPGDESSVLRRIPDYPPARYALYAAPFVAGVTAL